MIQLTIEMTNITIVVDKLAANVVPIKSLRGENNHLNTTITATTAHLI